MRIFPSSCFTVIFQTATLSGFSPSELFPAEDRYLFQDPSSLDISNLTISLPPEVYPLQSVVHPGREYFIASPNSGSPDVSLSKFSPS